MKNQMTLKVDFFKNGVEVVIYSTKVKKIIAGSNI